MDNARVKAMGRYKITKTIVGNRFRNKNGLQRLIETDYLAMY